MHFNCLWLHLKFIVHGAHLICCTKLETLNARPMQVLTWNSNDLDDYVAEAIQLVKELDALLMYIKDAVGQTQGILQQWHHAVIFERKEGKTFTFDELNNTIQEFIIARHAAMAGARHCCVLDAQCMYVHVPGKQTLACRWCQRDCQAPCCTKPLIEDHKKLSFLAQVGTSFMLLW